MKTLTNTKSLVEARDGLRNMFRLWHQRGPHATFDAVHIERAILALDEALISLTGSTQWEEK